MTGAAARPSLTDGRISKPLSMELGIHFIHVRSPHPNALPIILTHGWPSTVLLFRDVIAPLTDPTAHGGTAADAFDVIIPSLPGFAFSDKPVTRGWNADRTARAWTQLMQRLGYSRYVAQGGDWGAFVTTAMAQQRPPGLAAIHLNFAQTMPNDVPSDLLPDQKRAVEARKAWREEGGAYFQLQATRPQLAGYITRRASRVDLRHLQRRHRQYGRSRSRAVPRCDAGRDHALLADEQRGIVGAFLSRTSCTPQQAQQSRTHRPAPRRQRLPARPAGGAQLGAHGLSSLVLLERARSGRPFCIARGSCALHGGVAPLFRAMRSA